MEISAFKGKATIRVNFQSRAEYEKFRIYILKTDWSYALDYPCFEEMVVDFENMDDLLQINTKIIMLLQMGFRVYCCRYQMEQHLAEEEHPMDDEAELYIDDEPMTTYPAKETTPVMQKDETILT